MTEKFERFEFVRDANGVVNRIGITEGGARAVNLGPANADAATVPLEGDDPFAVLDGLPSGDADLDGDDPFAVLDKPAADPNNTDPFAVLDDPFAVLDDPIAELELQLEQRKNPAPTSADFDILDTGGSADVGEVGPVLRDLPGQVVGGVLDAFEQAGDTAESILPLGSLQVTPTPDSELADAAFDPQLLGSPSLFQVERIPQFPELERSMPEVEPAETTPGNVTRGVS